MEYLISSYYHPGFEKLVDQGVQREDLTGVRMLVAQWVLMKDPVCLIARCFLEIWYPTEREKKCLIKEFMTLCP